MDRIIGLRWRVSAAPLAALLLAAGPAPPSQPTAIAWSTYLRAGPGQTYEAISELAHDTPVRVLSCDAGWCRVSGEALLGYVDREALDLPRTPPPSTARKDCVVVGQADNRGPIPTRFCSAVPVGN